MKLYIKPQTEITIVKARTAMLQTSVNIDNTKQDNVVGTAKERDVWSDGFWD